MNEAFGNLAAFNTFYSYSSAIKNYEKAEIGDSISAWSGLWVGALMDATMEDTRLVVQE